MGKRSAKLRGRDALATAGRAGGLAAGRTRKKLIPAARRKEIASKAAKARWAKKKI